MVAANRAKLVVADTSVWIDHFRRGNDKLVESLTALRVGTHEFIIGELILGTLPLRSAEAQSLATLPLVPTARHEECVEFIERHGLVGQGLGWVDAHLLVSIHQYSAQIWTLDRAVRKVADRLGLLSTF
jgi:predicted nucleic acid-binding protein